MISHLGMSQLSIVENLSSFIDFSFSSLLTMSKHINTLKLIGSPHIFLQEVVIVIVVVTIIFFTWKKLTIQCFISSKIKKTKKKDSETKLNKISREKRRVGWGEATVDTACLVLTGATVDTDK